MTEPTAPASWIPTRKWIAATVTSGIGIVLMFITGDSEIADSEIFAAGGWLIGALGSYIYPNEVSATGTGVRARQPADKTYKGDSDVR